MFSCYCVTALLSRVTWVPAKSLPLIDAPVFRAIEVLDKITPLNFAVVPMSAAAKVCQ